MHTHIRIRGARTHNLKNISLDIPRDQLVVITGLSGSGKSSLAFDTLYAEGQRRYIESLSAYARQFLSMMEKPEVDSIEGLSPAVSIEQKTTSHNPRSTVGTVTEIHDYLRLLFARVGIPYCPEHGGALQAQTVSQMVDQIVALPSGSRWMLLAPVVRARKGEQVQLLQELRSKGYVRARIDGQVTDLDQAPALDKQKKHTIEVIVDRFSIRDDLAQRVAESLENALELADGLALACNWENDREQILFSARFSCPICGFSIGELEPKLFSFNNPAGACSQCDGMGVEQYFDPQRLIPDSKLSLDEGAIRGWEPHNPFLYQLIKSVLDYYHADTATPIASLPKKVRQAILYGSQDKIRFSYTSEKGTVFARTHAFEGIIPNLQRRYRDTSSDQVREDLGRFIRSRPCSACGGKRLNLAARHVRIEEYNIASLSALPIHLAQQRLSTLKLVGKRGEIANKILREICDRLGFLVNVGLDYLSLDRSAQTLSGGEAQRIRLARQVGAALVGVMYVLDEPSIGLHQRDNARLLATLQRLRDLGNTVIVVEHDAEAMQSADFLIDIGPGAGVHGGEVVACGAVADVVRNPRSITGAYLCGREQIAVPEKRCPMDADKVLRIKGGCINNLKNIEVVIPLGLFTCVTGVSGSGKSTLINQTLLPMARHLLNRAQLPDNIPTATLEGLHYLDKAIVIDQSPIGRTPRSNPATYTGLFTPIRELFAATPEARVRGYKPGRFSFNVKGGRCEACQGDGVTKVAMHFLPDVYVPCDDCQGKRYNRETLGVHYKHRNIHQVLDMTVEEAADFFAAVPQLARKLRTLMDVGLSYIRLGQSAITLSGGEAQRIKLARELSRRDTGNTLYVLDEPTTGLHFQDVRQLLVVLHRLRDQGSTIVVIEHNLDVIKTADWVIDLGPEGGEQGGEVVAFGAPETVAQHPDSHTARFLRAVLESESSTSSKA